MKKKVELPLSEPVYTTYHGQAVGGAAIYANPSVRNWYLTQAVILSCSRSFLSGFTTPDIDIVQSAWFDNPCFDKRWYPKQYVDGYINPIIRKLIDDGYYVYFDYIDDYYIEGKSWYKERHVSHDGMICGYDQEKKTYSLYAYDSNWICRRFETSQRSFNAARKAMSKQGIYGGICGIKPLAEQFEFCPDTVRQKLAEYLDSSPEKYPVTEEGRVFGIAVHDYIAMYIDRLFEGLVPYERMDRRVFRLIWEHKKVMLERLQKTEESLKLDSELSTAYKKLVAEADTMRMLYASHHLKRRDAVLPIIRKKLLSLKQEEWDILTEAVKKMEAAQDT